MKYEPHIFSDIDMAFPAHVVEHMPKMDEMPEAFRKGEHPACSVANGIFFGRWAGKKPGMVARDGVNPSDAWRHLHCIMSSFEPAHEHKEAAWGFLLNEWFYAFLIDDKVVWKADDAPKFKKGKGDKKKRKKGKRK